MKNEKTKLIIWAVIALVIGVVIGMIITNATTGNAKKIMTGIGSNNPASELITADECPNPPCNGFTSVTNTGRTICNCASGGWEFCTENTVRFISETGCANAGGTVGPCREPHNANYDECCLVIIGGHEAEQIIFTIPNDSECIKNGGTPMNGTTNGVTYRICRWKNGFESTIVGQ